MAVVLISETEGQLSGNNYPKIAIRIEWYRNNDGSGVDAADNEEVITGKAFLIKRGENANGSTSHNLNGPGSVTVLANTDTDVDLELVHSSSGIDYDWRSTSGRNAKGTTQLLWEGAVTVQHNTDGTKTMAFSVTWTGDSNLGSRTISGSVTLPTITQVPNAPTGVVATRLSDSSVKVDWAQSHPGNGQPTTNSVRRRINGGAAATITTVAPTNTVTVAAAGNQKLEYGALAANAAGDSAWSAWSAPIYTTPAAPTGLTATKNADGDIELAWVKNAAYSEHQQPIEHSTDNGATWAPLYTAASSLTTYKHVSPNPAQTHKYRIKAESTTGALSSAWSTSENVQLLAPPNKPTLPDLPDFADKGSAFELPWVHNPVDTTAQTAYEAAYSTNGGDSWTSTGKTTSTGGSKSYAAGTWSADQSVLFRVRTWGQATSGGSDGTGASPWSDPQAVTFKTAPVATITSPADESTYEEATLSVTLGFSQAESATFVQATVTLLDDADEVLETVVSGSLSGITFDTIVEDGGSYKVSAVVKDSNGVLSAAAVSEFDIAYTLPVAAGVTVEYIDGVAQLTLTFPEPGEDEVAAVAVTVTRAINGETETLETARAVTGPTDTIIDTLPTIRGTNTYTIRTISEDGAYAETQAELVTAEDQWVYLSTGPGFADIVKFSRGVRFGSAPQRESSLVVAAGRSKPIALFGPLRTLEVQVTAKVLEADVAALVGDAGSTVDEIEELLLNATRAYLRDPTGRRICGVARGVFTNRNGIEADFALTLTEAT